MSPIELNVRSLAQFLNLLFKEFIMLNKIIPLEDERKEKVERGGINHVG